MRQPSPTSVPGLEPDDTWPLRFSPLSPITRSTAVTVRAPRHSNAPTTSTCTCRQTGRLNSELKAPRTAMIPSGRGSMGTSPLMSSSFTSRVDAGYLYMIGPYCSQMAKVEFNSSNCLAMRFKVAASIVSRSPLL